MLNFHSVGKKSALIYLLRVKFASFQNLTVKPAGSLYAKTIQGSFYIKAN